MLRPRPGFKLKRVRREFLQDKSHKSRLAARARVSDRLHGAGVSRVELHRARVYVDDQGNHTTLPSGIHNVIATSEMLTVKTLADASIFICQNPWRPCDRQIKWAAVLSGAWIMTAETLMGLGPATCIKFKSALQTRRKIFVSPSFRDDEPGIYTLILEIMIAAGTSKWVWLASGAEWASASVAAEKGNRSAEVLALVTSKDAWAGLPHVFQAYDFLKFVANQDHARTTLGIGIM